MYKETNVFAVSTDFHQNGISYLSNPELTPFPYQVRVDRDPLLVDAAALPDVSEAELEDVGKVVDEGRLEGLRLAPLRLQVVLN